LLSERELTLTKKILITGITGQDGAYLADLCLREGSIVYGGYRRLSTPNFWRLEFLKILHNKNLRLLEIDLTDTSSLHSVFNEIKFDEVYNLAAQSHVQTSFSQPIYTANVTALGALNILECIRLTNKDTKFYQASTSEMYGKVQEIPQTEKTFFYPRSPYGVAKLYAHWITINYRESYDIFASSGILFNHESPIRGPEFVTRKITLGVSRIKKRLQSKLELGNLDAKRDWGFARDFVLGMQLMLQHDKPDTFILSTNQSISVREFVKKSFNAADIDIVFDGNGIDEKGFDNKTGEIILEVNKNFYRPAEVEYLRGDYSHAKNCLNWSPKTNIDELCKMMVESDLHSM